jgi:hypothetical protein
MPSLYPGAYDVFDVHGTLMNEEPLHDDVHVKVEDAIKATQAELGLNPSGPAATVVARLNTIEASSTAMRAQLGTTPQSSSYATVQAATTDLRADVVAMDAAKTEITSRFVTITGGTSALGNNAINLRAGTVVLTLAAFGVGTITYPSSIAAAYVPMVCNGDTGTSNGGASVGCDTWSTTTLTGSVRINYQCLGV